MAKTKNKVKIITNNLTDTKKSAIIKTDAQLKEEADMLRFLRGARDVYENSLKTPVAPIGARTIVTIPPPEYLTKLPPITFPPQENKESITKELLANTKAKISNIGTNLQSIGNASLENAKSQVTDAYAGIKDKAGAAYGDAKKQIEGAVEDAKALADVVRNFKIPKLPPIPEFKIKEQPIPRKFKKLLEKQQALALLDAAKQSVAQAQQFAADTQAQLDDAKKRATDVINQGKDLANKAADTATGIADSARAQVNDAVNQADAIKNDTINGVTQQANEIYGNPLDLINKKS
jgi:cell division septum initiation protein DivIVA